MQSAQRGAENVCSAACSTGHLVVPLNSGCRRCFSSVWLLFMTLLFVNICRGEGIYPLILQDFSQAWNFERGSWVGKHSSDCLFLSACFPRGALCVWHHYSCRFQYPGEPEGICAAVPTEEPGGTCLTNVCLCLPWWELIYPSFFPTLQIGLTGTTKELRKGWLPLGALHNLEHFWFAFEGHQAHSVCSQYQWSSWEHFSAWNWKSQLEWRSSVGAACVFRPQNVTASHWEES